MNDPEMSQNQGGDGGAVMTARRSRARAGSVPAPPRGWSAVPTSDSRNSHSNSGGGFSLRAWLPWSSPDKQEEPAFSESAAPAQSREWSPDGHDAAPVDPMASLWQECYNFVVSEVVPSLEPSSSSSGPEAPRAVPYDMCNRYQTGKFGVFVEYADGPGPDTIPLLCRTFGPEKSDRSNKTSAAAAPVEGEAEGHGWALKRHEETGTPVLEVQLQPLRRVSQTPEQRRLAKQVRRWQTEETRYSRLAQRERRALLWNLFGLLLVALFAVYAVYAPYLALSSTQSHSEAKGGDGTHPPDPVMAHLGSVGLTVGHAYEDLVWWLIHVDWPRTALLTLTPARWGPDAILAVFSHLPAIPTWDVSGSSGKRRDDPPESPQDSQSESASPTTTPTPTATATATATATPDPPREAHREHRWGSGRGSESPPSDPSPVSPSSY